PVRLDPRGGQHRAVQGRVPALAPRQDVAEPPLVPADVGLGRLADHQIRTQGPAHLAEVVPPLAGGMTGHRAVDDLHGGPAAPARARERSSTRRPAGHSTRSSARTPQPATIESPTIAMRKVPAGLSIA